ncbi:S8 family peptidase [Piscinibacter sp. HJYY11]|nr:S8 family peptidase [Piscinibacter sp. HJYY11]
MFAATGLLSWTAVHAAPVDGLIVKLKDAPAHERAAQLGASASAMHTERLQGLLQTERMTEARTRPAGRDAQHLDFGRRLSQDEARAMAERLRARPEVDWVEPNSRERLLQAAPTPNDVYFPYVSPTDLGQWWLRPEGETTGNQLPSFGAPGVQNAWALQTGQPTAVVAVLDTGITSHVDLAGRVLPGRDFVSDVEYANDGNGRDADASDPGDWVSQADINGNPALFGDCPEQPSSWHGTIISGIVAAATNNTIGVAGISWNGRVLPVRVAGKCGATVLDITDGMRWAAGLPVPGAPANPNPARIVNVSFGGSAACGNLYQSTVDELASLGVVVVAAAGNEMGAVTRPASCNGVVGVAALARDGLKASYSNFGPQVTIATVGGDADADDGLLTLINTGTQAPGADGYGNVFGTSFATPVVAGVVSLMLSTNPQLSVAQVITGLRTTARPHVQSSSGVPACSASARDVCVCTTSTCGAGVLDADAAVRYAASPSSPSAPRDDGGGALGLAWLLGLALAVAALARAGREPLPVRAGRRR